MVNYTTIDSIKKFNDSLWSIGKLLCYADNLDSTEFEGLSTVILDLSSKIDNKLCGLTAYEEDTKEELNNKLLKSKQIVENIEQALSKL